MKTPEEMIRKAFNICDAQKVWNGMGWTYNRVPADLIIKALGGKLLEPNDVVQGGSIVLSAEEVEQVMEALRVGEEVIVNALPKP